MIILQSCDSTFLHHAPLIWRRFKTDCFSPVQITSICLKVQHEQVYSVCPGTFTTAPKKVKRINTGLTLSSMCPTYSESQEIYCPIFIVSVPRYLSRTVNHLHLFVFKIVIIHSMFLLGPAVKRPNSVPTGNFYRLTSDLHDRARILYNYEVIMM